jgi:hypothetical protein
MSPTLRLVLCHLRLAFQALFPSPQLSVEPEELEEFKLGGRYFGVMTRIAAQRGTSVGTVSAVAHGKLKSKSILAALRAEMKTAEHNPPVKRARKQRSVPFSPEELSEFSHGKYRGLQVGVARSLGVGECRVHEVIHGRLTSARILAEVKAGIKRIDAERGL